MFLPAPVAIVHTILIEASQGTTVPAPVASNPLVAALKDLIYFVDQVGEETDLMLNGAEKDNK